MQPRQAASECVTWERQLVYLCYYLCYLHERLGAGFVAQAGALDWAVRVMAPSAKYHGLCVCARSVFGAGYILGYILPSATVQVRPIYWVKGCAGSVFGFTVV
jgi:hypothetical protein